VKPTKRPQAAQAAQVAFAKKATAMKADNTSKVKAAALINTPSLLEGVDEAPAAALPAREHHHTRAHASRGPPYLLDKGEVLAIANVSFPTIWAWMRAGTFPRSRVCGGKSMWISSEVEAWLANLPVRKLKGDQPAEVA
jgi:predicted DNA-binding transcriptional regulator AlpA